MFAMNLNAIGNVINNHVLSQLVNLNVFNLNAKNNNVANVKKVNKVSMLVNLILLYLIIKRIYLVLMNRILDAVNVEKELN